MPQKLAAEPSKLFRVVKALQYAIKKPKAAQTELKQAILNLFSKSFLESNSLAKKDLFELIPLDTEVRLNNFHSRNGNVSSYELLCISSIISVHQPKILLEIGTFDGNTTLQMAINAPDGSIVHTIDLPPMELDTKEPLLAADITFVMDKDKNHRKYTDSKAASKIIQHFGDSTNFDFQLFASKGKVDFAFIDGGHSYECVKSDTENLLKVLSPNGIIMWHDYNPNWFGVYRYINELSHTLPIVHIRDTSLAYYKPLKL